MNKVKGWIVAAGMALASIIGLGGTETAVTGVATRAAVPVVERWVQHSSKQWIGIDDAGRYLAGTIRP